MRMTAQPFQWIAAILVAAAILFSSACSIPSTAEDIPGAGAPPRVATMKVTPQSISRTVTLQGELQPFQDVDLHAKVAGYVKQLYVDVGSHVQQGQLLAVLAVPEFEHEQEQASAVIDRRKAEITRAEGQLRRAESAHEAIHLSAGRLAEVSDSKYNLVAQQEIDDALSKDKAAEAEVSAGRAALAAAQAALQDAKANLERVRALIEYSRITSPFPGVVTKRYAHTGAMIPAGTSTTNQGLPVVRITQNDPLRLVIPVPESVVSLIHSGMQVRVQVPALNRSFLGSVSRFSRELDTSTRTMHTEVDVSNPKLEMAPGEYAEVQITLEHRDNVLSVPVEAVLARSQQPAVLVVNRANVVERRAVSLGIESPARVEILSGLRRDDLVVINIPRQLKPGQLVNPEIVAAPAARGEN